LWFGESNFRAFPIDLNHYKQTFFPHISTPWINWVNPHTHNECLLPFLGLVSYSVLLNKQEYLGGIWSFPATEWMRWRADHLLHFSKFVFCLKYVFSAFVTQILLNNVAYWSNCLFEAQWKQNEFLKDMVSGIMCSASDFLIFSNLMKMSQIWLPGFHIPRVRNIFYTSYPVPSFIKTKV
jgi:hypothetical protein